MPDLKNNEFSRELKVSISAALKAGQILLAHFHQPVAISWKGPGDPVTSADQEASAFLLRSLAFEFPDDGSLSEEGPLPPQAQNHRMWIVDPMDGTREFIDHRDEFSVMIGLVASGTPVLGVIYQPVTGKLYYALLNGGAFLRENGREIALHVSKEREPALMTIAVSRSHHTADVDRVCKRLGITRSIACGSLGLKVGLICGGQAHLYIHPGPETSLWDTCAANAILTEAGGKLTSCDGTPLRYNPPDLRHTRGVVASTGVIHRRIVEAISDVRAITGR